MFAMKIKLYHLLLFFGLVVSAVLCNTQEDREGFLSRNKSWKFADDAIEIKAKHIDDLLDGGVYKYVQIKQNGKLLFEDEKMILTDNFGLLPIVRSVGEERYELLLGVKSPNVDKIFRFFIEKESILEADTLPMFGGTQTDADEDGLVEFSGFTDQFAPPCADCDSLVYNPLHFYEMRPEGFCFDSLATRHWIETHFGAFHGFAPKSDLVVEFWE